MEIKSVIRNIPTKEKVTCFTSDFYQIFKDDLTSILKFLQNIEEEERLSNLFYLATIILLPKPERHKMKNNYKPISLLNIDAKIINKMLTNRIQQHIQHRVRSPSQSNQAFGKKCIQIRKEEV